MFVVGIGGFCGASCLVRFGTDFFSKSFLWMLLEMVIFSGSALTSSGPNSKNPEFHDLVQRDKSNWPRYLLWHGLLLALAYPGGRSLG